MVVDKIGRKVDEILSAYDVIAYFFSLPYSINGNGSIGWGDIIISADWEDDDISFYAACHHHLFANEPLASGGDIDGIPS